MAVNLRRPPVAFALPAEKFFQPGLGVCPLVDMSMRFRHLIGGTRLRLVPQPTAVWTIDRSMPMIEVLTELKDDIEVVLGEVWTGLLEDGAIARDGAVHYFWVNPQKDKAALGSAVWSHDNMGWVLDAVPESALIETMFEPGHRIIYPKAHIIA